MDLKKKILKTLYPLIMRLSKATSRGKVLQNQQRVAPAESFYRLEAVLNNGQPLDFGQLRGKKVLLVNTASNCGFTGQYQELQELYQRHQDQLVVIGFPANDFREQEQDDDQTISQFCQVNFGVTFPLAKKSKVVKAPDQHPVYRWLTHANQNGWNQHQPDWNFSKFLVDEQGVLTHYFGPAVSPTGEEVTAALAKPAR
ncbi:glutathione peroxidase [Rufibacter psychrotolerans]|uniref:glutathione peroxidase n=1 Tax=Rufibacter psychrotolerans TaxID=2812556 RepID=UPI0019673067|nr:glutathione peroxidase [Rufibacter sp. SYSU D00308]